MRVRTRRDGSGIDVSGMGRDERFGAARVCRAGRREHGPELRLQCVECAGIKGTGDGRRPDRGHGDDAWLG